MDLRMMEDVRMPRSIVKNESGGLREMGTSLHHSLLDVEENKWRIGKKWKENHLKKGIGF